MPFFIFAVSFLARWDIFNLPNRQHREETSGGRKKN